MSGPAFTKVHKYQACPLNMHTILNNNNNNNMQNAPIQTVIIEPERKCVTLCKKKRLIYNFILKTPGTLQSVDQIKACESTYCV